MAAYFKVRAITSLCGHKIQTFNNHSTSTTLTCSLVLIISDHHKLKHKTQDVLYVTAGEEVSKKATRLHSDKNDF